MCYWTVSQLLDFLLYNLIHSILTYGFLSNSCTWATQILNTFDQFLIFRYHYSRLINTSLAPEIQFHSRPWFCVEFVLNSLVEKADHIVSKLVWVL